MNRIMSKAEAKAQVLSRWTQDSVEIFNQVCAKWKEFNILLSRHKETIHQQVYDKIMIYELCYLILDTVIPCISAAGQFKIQYSVPDHSIHDPS